MNASLIKVDVAASMLGWNADRLFDLVEGGTLIEPGFEWVFDFSTVLAHGQQGRRNLRFAAFEIDARAQGRTLRAASIEKSIERILPPKRRTLHAGEVDGLFQLRPHQRIELFEGTLAAGRHFYERAVLSEFLTARWIGAGVRLAQCAPPAARETNRRFL